MKRIIFTILIFTAVSKISAQQLQTSAFYELNGNLHNASLAGIGTSNFVGTTYRTQWKGMEGAPKTVTAFGSFALPKQKLGISGYVFNDATGPTSQTGLSVSIAKHILLSNKSKLSLGIENRLEQFSINQAKLIETLGSDPAIGSANNSFRYDAGFGISYTNDRLQLGASVAQLLQTKQNNYTGTLVRSQEARFYRHYYLHGSYVVNLDETSTLTPNFLVIYLPNAPTEYNLGAKFRYDDFFSLGVNASASLNVGFSVGLKVNKSVAFDYAYNIYSNPSDNQNVELSAHELMLRFFFK